MNVPEYQKIIESQSFDQHEASIEKLNTAVSISPNNIDYRFELGRMFFNRGVSQNTLEQKQTSAIASPSINEEGVVDEDLLSINDQTNTENVQTIKADQNQDLATAKALFNSVLQVSSNHANAIYSLALIAETEGDKTQAKQYYEQLLGIVHDQETKDAILEKLKSL